MKKKLWFLLLTVLVFSLIVVACGNNDNDSDSDSGYTTPNETTDSGGEEVTLQMLFAESLFGYVHEDLIAQFEDEHPNITIQAESVPDGRIFDTLRTRITTDDVPDLFQINIGHVTTNQAMEAGYISDLSNLDASQHYAASISEATSIDGVQALMSLGVGVLGLPYNIDMLADVGYDEPPQTWDELIDLGEKLQAEGMDMLVYASAWETAIGNVFHWTFGHHAILDPEFREAYETNTIDWSRPEYRAILEEGFERFNQLNEFVQVGSFTNEYAIAQQAFTNENAAIVLGGTWEAGVLRDLNPDLEFGFMNLPYADGAENPFIFIPEDGIAINDQSEKKEYAEIFIEWLFSPENYLVMQEAKGTFSAYEGVGELDPAYEEVPGWLTEAGRVISFANTGPIPGQTFVALGNTAQEYTFEGDLEQAIERFISEYERTMD